MLAQVVFEPSGIVAVLGAGVVVGAVVVVAGAGSVVVASPHPADSSAVGLVFHSKDSSVGIEIGWVSLILTPLVVAGVDLPRAPPRPPRSTALPRPRPLSVPRPPRADRAPPAGVESGVELVSTSFFALGRVRSFFGFETSPHCGMVPTTSQPRSPFESSQSSTLPLPCIPVAWDTGQW